jgi:hypothetical protein
MQTSTLVSSLQRRTAGPWVHSGHLIVQAMDDTGTLLVVTLPDDFRTGVTRAEFDALAARVTTLEGRMTSVEARVAALEARPVIDAVEDLVYGN